MPGHSACSVCGHQLLRDLWKGDGNIDGSEEEMGDIPLPTQDFPECAMIDIIFSTEMRLLEPICTFQRLDGYNVYRSDRFPSYYGGNGIQIGDPGAGSLREWEEIFRSHFEPGRFEHTTFTFPLRDRFLPLMEQARSAGYHVETDAYMFADSTDCCHPLPEGVEIRRIETEEDWEDLARFEEATYVDGDWYDPDYTGPDRLFEKKRFTSEAIGIDWFGLVRPGGRELLARLGIFQHNGICRLQDVETAEEHRRRGLAGALVSFAIEHAITTLGTAGLALSADLDYHAIDLYRNLGFREVGEYVEMMNYPVRNPRFMAASAPPAET